MFLDEVGLEKFPPAIVLLPAQYGEVVPADVVVGVGSVFSDRRLLRFCLGESGSMFLQPGLDWSACFTYVGGVALGAGDAVDHPFAV